MALHLKLASEIQTLEPSARVSLYELHLEDEVLRFHPGTNEFFKPLVWQGIEYLPFPVNITGFEKNTQGTMPRPKMTVSNVDGVISKMLRERDIVGSKVVRRRTLARYLDEVNFKDGNPMADPSVEFPIDIYYLDQKKSEANSAVEFELRSPLEMTNVLLPRRQIIQNACSWRYRYAECGYTGGPVADIYDNPTGDPKKDQCSKKLSACKARFGNGTLPFGGFPAAGLMRT